jgi:hypothetical protein
VVIMLDESMTALALDLMRYIQTFRKISSSRGDDLK